MFVLSFCLLAISCLSAADFTVAPAGRDSAPGTQAQPFASLERARLAVRELKRQQPERRKPIVVCLRGGIYYLPKPLTFTPEDSGTSLSPVVYEAAPNEEPVLSAGQSVTGWTKTSSGRWQAQLPEAKNGGWVFSQLYVNNQRRFRPVWPRKGYSFVAAASRSLPTSALISLFFIRVISIRTGNASRRLKCALSTAGTSRAFQSVPWMPLPVRSPLREGPGILR